MIIVAGLMVTPAGAVTVKTMALISGWPSYTPFLRWHAVYPLYS